MNICMLSVYYLIIFHSLKLKNSSEQKKDEEKKKNQNMFEHVSVQKYLDV